MALLGLEYKKHPTIPKYHWVKVIDDDGIMERNLQVPTPRPPEYDTNADWVIDQVRKMIRTIRSRKARADAAAAEAAELTQIQDTENPNENVDTVLAMLQAEFDG